MTKLSLHSNCYWSTFDTLKGNRTTGFNALLFILSSMIILTGCTLNRVCWKPEPEELLTHNVIPTESSSLKARFFGTVGCTLFGQCNLKLP